MRSRVLRPALPVVLAIAATAFLGGPRPRLTAADEASREAGNGLTDLTFMAGCWQAIEPDGRGRRIVEHYTAPLANVMLGTTRYVSGDSATGFELTTILRRGSQVVLTPYPDGVASEHGFRLTRSGRGEAVFEAPEHDFPKRIAYRRGPRGELVARIDGGDDPDAGAASWTMAPAACAPAVPR